MNKENKKAFTLIEMVVAIFIIIIAVVGIIEMTSKYVQRTKFEKEAYTAALLGQEGVEIIKNIRDNNWIDGGVNWNNNLTSCGSGCQADYSSNTLSAYDGSYLYIENTTKFYKYISSPGANDIKTVFTRRITIDSGTADILKITVDVFWRGNTTTVKENIYNWYQP